MESVKLQVTEDSFTDIDTLITRIQNGIASTWANPGSGQLDISVVFGYNWRVSDGTTEYTYTERQTLLEISPTIVSAMVATVLSAAKTMLATSSFTTFVSASGFGVVTVRYDN